MITFTQILGCDGTALYELDDQGISFKNSGRLQILLAYDGMIMLRLDDFEYGVNSSDQILYEESDPQFKIVLHLKRYPKGKWIVKINEHTDEVFSCLNEKCYLKTKKSTQSRFSSISSNGKDDENCKDKKQLVKEPRDKKKKKVEEEKKYYNLQEEEEERQKQPVTAGSVLVTASKGLGWGLAMTGKALSKGFEAIGGLASKAVKPAAEKVEVSENAKANIELAKKTSKSVLTFTAQQVSNLFQFGKEAASNIGERFEKSEKGKQLQENSKYQPVKQGAKTGVKVFSNIYEGVVEGIYEIGSGISKGTSKVVGKKYGEDAGEAADEIFEGAGNIVKIARVPNDQAAKAFKD